MLQLRNKFISTLLCCCLIATVIPIFTFTSSALEDNYEYEILDGEITITKYLGNESNLIIPSTFGGLPVTRIGDKAFWHCESLVHVTIPNSVSSIGNFSFSTCDNLKQITIPDSVISIGRAAFLQCSSLTNVQLPDSVTTIGGAHFKTAVVYQPFIFPTICQKLILTYFHFVPTYVMSIFLKMYLPSLLRLLMVASLLQT